MSKGSLAAARLRSFALSRAVGAAVLLLSLGFLGYKVYTSWSALRGYDWQIHYIYLIPSFGLYLVQFAVIVWGWQAIMNSLTHRLPLWDHVRIYGYTHLLQRIPAGLLWMVAGRAQAYRKHDISIGQSAVASSVELVVGILTGLPLAALAAWVLGALSPLAGTLLTVVGLALEVGALHPAVLNRLLRLVRKQNVQAVLTYRHTMLWALIYTLIWLVCGAGLFLIARLFTNLPVADLPRTISAWVLSSLVAYVSVLSPTGLGVKELSLTVALGLYLPDPLPLLIALSIRAIWTVFDILVGVAAWLL